MPTSNNLLFGVFLTFRQFSYHEGSYNINQTWDEENELCRKLDIIRNIFVKVGISIWSYKCLLVWRVDQNHEKYIPYNGPKA